MDFVDYEEFLTRPRPKETGAGGIVKFIRSLFANACLFIASNGWYIIAGGIACYYLWRRYAKDLFPQRNQNINMKPQSPEEVAAFLAKEKERKLAVKGLQEKYLKDVQIREEEMKKLEEVEKKARVARVIKCRRFEEKGYKENGFNGAGPGRSLGSGQPQFLDGESESEENSAEYNPSMGVSRPARAYRFIIRRSSRGSGDG